MMKSTQWMTLALCCSAMWVGTTSDAFADKKGKGKTEKKGKSDKKDKGDKKDKSDKKDKDKKSDYTKDLDKKIDKHIDKKDFDDWKFDDKGKDDVRNFYKKYADKDGGLPPGLAKKVRNGKPLPPGWKKKVNAGSVLDDDIWGLLSPLSGSDLPASFKVSDDVGAYLLGDRILRVDKKSRKTLDYIDVPSIKLK
jgi:hypothetical protein